MRFLMLLLLMSSTSFAQLQVTKQIVSQMEFREQPRVVGNTVYFKPGTRGVESEVAFIAVQGRYETIDVFAERMAIVNNEIVIEDAEVKLVGDQEYSFAGNGTYSVQVIGYGPGVSRYPRFKMTLRGTPPPGPGPGPGPGPDPLPIPADQFDNIAQRVANLSAGLPKAKEVGAIYAKYASELANNQSMDVVKAISATSTERLALLGSDGPAYNAITTALNADLQSRWSTMSKGLLSEWLKCVSIGYGAKP